MQTNAERVRLKEKKYLMNGLKIIGKRKKACFSWYPSMDIGVLPSCVGYVVERYITYNNRIYSICNIRYILYTVYRERRIKDVFDKEF